MSNVTIGSIESIAPTARLYLNGFTLKVRTVKDKEIDALVGTRILLEGTEDAPGQLRWKPQGMALIVR